MVLSHRAFWLHLVLVGLFLFLVAVGTLYYLSSYTDHGESITVPPLQGMTLEEAKEFIQDKAMELHVMDSIFNPALKPGEIINQTPTAGSKVKEGRTLYLTIRSYTPEKEPLPDVEGISLRNAISKLTNAGFAVGDRIYKPYKYTNAIIYVSKDGKKVEPGQLFEKGTKFNLVVGNGLGNTKVRVPDLLGNTLEEAEFILLGGYNLNIGIATYDSTSVLTREDTLNAVIYAQQPKPEEELRVGEFVNVRLMTEKKFKMLMDSTWHMQRDSLQLADSLDNVMP